MHGRSQASSRSSKHHQLPLVTDAKVHDRTEEAEVINGGRKGDDGGSTVEDYMHFGRCCLETELYNNDKISVVLDLV